MPGTDDDRVRRLCSLIYDSIHGPIEEEADDAVALTKDRERALLLSLSQVLREIRSWIRGGDRGSGYGGCRDQHCEDHDCLLKIVAKLICLLNVKSQYVQHLAGSILVAASEFFASSGRVWRKFISLLCDCFVMGFSNILPYSSPLTFDDGKFSCDVLTFNVLKSRLRNADWNTGSGILGVFHSMLKCLKEEDNEQLLEQFMDSLGSWISSVPWGFLDMLKRCGNDVGNTDSCKDSLHFKCALETGARILFLGNLVQFLSSLVGPSGLEETPAHSRSRLLILHKILDLVPKILHWCLDEDWKCKSLQILPYLRHKTLMLMVRLSSQIHFDGTTLVLWLGLLHEYYQDLLMDPICHLDSSDDDSLEGSPFQLSCLDQETKSPSCHLRGQAIFLFLRCCLHMIVLREASDCDCAYMRQNSCLTPNINTAEDCCEPRRGLLELYKWLEVQVSSAMIGQCKEHVEKRIMFASVLIQLYMHEDDMLFEVLLLLLSISNCADRMVKEMQGSQADKDYVLSHVSNHFNPVILFYVLLANLQYDHQLLLDYLISKDTGTKCAEYLLRCLRALCDSWDFFLELSQADRRICKKKRSILESLVSYEEPPSQPGEYVHIVSLEEHKIDSNLEANCSRIRSLEFAGAKSCLISLKVALEKLRRKRLFPYNPEVLLKRLTKFEELSDEHVNSLARKISLKNN